MKFIGSIFLCILCLLTACAYEETGVGVSSAVQITGNGYSLFQETSRATDFSEIPQGAHISLYATGSLSAEDLRLTLYNKEWRSEIPLSWKQPAIGATITAHFPPLHPDSSLYDERGGLKDRLLCQKTYAWGKPIELHFRHAYAKATFHLPDGFNATLQSIVVTPSHRLTAIRPHDAQYSIEENSGASVITERISVHESGIYTCYVPPTAPIALTLLFTQTDGKQYRVQLPSQTYSANVNAHFHLRKQEKGGIYTVEDFIAFSALLRQNEYKGRRLEEFGQVANGRRVYRLKTDLVLTETDMAAYKEATVDHRQQRPKAPLYLHGTFDGEGHSISHLTVYSGKQDYVGLFPQLTAGDTVRHLHIKQVRMRIEDEAWDCAGGLVGLNEGGTVDDCSVENLDFSTSIALAKNHDIGGLIGKHTGWLINSAARHIRFREAKVIQVSGLAGGCYYKQSKILNCLISGYSAVSSAENCQIARNSAEATIANVFIEGEDGAQLALYGKGCSYLYYPQGKMKRLFKYKEGSSQLTSYIPTTKQRYVQHLNNWIEQTGTTTYPAIVFRTWESSPDASTLQFSPL